MVMKKKKKDAAPKKIDPTNKKKIDPKELDDKALDKVSGGVNAVPPPTGRKSTPC
jgi:bacteriocin-like protein